MNVHNMIFLTAGATAVAGAIDQLAGTGGLAAIAAAAGPWGMLITLVLPSLAHAIVTALQGNAPTVVTKP